MNSQTIAERITGLPGTWKDTPLCTQLAGLLQEKSLIDADNGGENQDRISEMNGQQQKPTTLRHSER